MAKRRESREQSTRNLGRGVHGSERDSRELQGGSPSSLLLSPSLWTSFGMVVQHSLGSALDVESPRSPINASTAIPSGVCALPEVMLPGESPKGGGLPRRRTRLLGGVTSPSSVTPGPPTDAERLYVGERRSSTGSVALQSELLASLKSRGLVGDCSAFITSNSINSIPPVLAVASEHPPPEHVASAEEEHAVDFGGPSNNFCRASINNKANSSRSAR
mmetsp:Transcript_91965/g.259819  ORF Transcript_91965/g.259819 Transcript_91965/m.259819 type:complete len:218 (+) Transcript_91965:265-918(+)